MDNSSDRSLDNESGLPTVPLRCSVQDPKPDKVSRTGFLESGRSPSPNHLVPAGWARCSPNLLEVMRWQSTGWQPGFTIGCTAGHAAWCRCEAKLGWLSTWPSGDNDGPGPPREAVRRRPNAHSSEGLIVPESRRRVPKEEAPQFKRNLCVEGCGDVRLLQIAA
jgi:hypothetical protein